MEKNSKPVNTIAESVIKVPVVNEKFTKRIDFDKSTFKKLEVMIPIYKDEVSGNATEKEILNYIIKKAIENLFKSDFTDKLNRL